MTKTIARDVLVKHYFRAKKANQAYYVDYYEVKLLAAFEPLVWATARKFKPVQGQDIEDITSYCRAKLHYALETYMEDAGAAFESYAIGLMKYGAMEARTKERLSNQCLTQEKKIKAALEICRQRSSVEPTIEEIADEAGLTEQEYLLALADMNYNYPTSLSQPLSDGITTVGDTLISDKSCYDCVSAIDTNDAINDILLLLPQDHRYIATLLIGGYTLSETATIIQKSMTSVSVMWADLAQFMYDHLIEIGYEEIFEGWFRDGELPPWRALFRRRVSSVGTIPLD